MSRIFRSQVLRRHIERVLTQTQLRSQRRMKRKFQEDYDVFRDDIEIMSQSLKKIVELLRKLLEENESSAIRQNIFFGLKTIARGLNISQAMPKLRNFACPLLTFSDLTHKFYSYQKAKEIWDEILKNMESYNKIADSAPIRGLLHSFAGLNKSLLTKKEKRGLMKKAGFLDRECYAPSSLEFVFAFSEMVIDNLFNYGKQEKKEMGDLIFDSIFTLAIPQFVELKGTIERTNLQKDGINEKILSLETKIQMIDIFMEFAEEMI